MNLEAFRYLLSPDGQAFLIETAQTPITPQNHLQIMMHLRQQLEPTLAQAVVETVVLRQKAAVKFSRAAGMYFTRSALEQASSEIVSSYRVQRFAEAGMHTVADLGCGIGGDALALTAVAHVIGVDLDELRLHMAQENVRVYGRNGRFQPVQADIQTLSPLPVDGLFFDPARRDEHGNRIYSVEAYRPPLSVINRWREKVKGTAVKISPGINYDEIPPDAEIEFISLNGEVKEGILWFGSLRSMAARRATLLPDGATLTNQPHEEISISEPLAYLYEPDGAVIRAHLVEELAQQLGAYKIDPTIAYLTANSAQPTPFARCFTVDTAFPFQLKRLRTYLRQHDIGTVTIKKRGSPLEPDWLRSQLRLKGSAHRIIFLTQIKEKAAVIIGQPLEETKK
ncbi:MAG: methyltransferase domain-containing protein [Anaerolineae bacterium]|nr:methyltransferase domain-containing protein [Anaerolineae bacterium]